VFVYSKRLLEEYRKTSKVCTKFPYNKSSEYVSAGHNEQVAADADVTPVCPYPTEQGVPEQVDQEVATNESEYVPAGQFHQAEAPVYSIHVPAGHNEQVADDADVTPVCPYFPEEQGVPEQVDEEVAPTISEYVPAGQFQQKETSVYSIYVPAGHNEQVADDADVALRCPYFPRSRGVPEQVDEEVAPTISEYVPVGQFQQAEASVYSIYVPAGHNEQVADDANVAPVCPYFPEEQGVLEQVDEEVAPTISEYVPAEQFPQAEAPVYSIYVPAGHNEQVAADADVTPVCPYFPDEQGVLEQVDEEVAPTISEYVPAGQGLHHEVESSTPRKRTDLDLCQFAK
jgi:hypothetical protein